MTPLTLRELEAGLPAIRSSPRDEGRLELIVRRPAIGERDVLETADLDIRSGLVGDSWHQRPSSRMPVPAPHPDMQINIMNVRVIGLVAGSRERWPLAGDQLFVDLDLSRENLPAGTRLSIGQAVLVVTDEPHTGCGKFAERFGVDAVKFVNGSMGRALNLRGINARVVMPGRIHVGDRVYRQPPLNVGSHPG